MFRQFDLDTKYTFGFMKVKLIKAFGKIQLPYEILRRV